MEEKVTTNYLEEKCFHETFVAPQWLPGGNSFWYRRQVDIGRFSKFKFILVDILAKSVRPAFDHHRLARALGRITGNKIDGGNLPFTWIELQDSVVRFRFQEHIWQYDPEKGLSGWPGKFTQGNALLMRRQEPSGSTLSSPHATVGFVNITRSKLDLFFVDGFGAANYFMPIPSGKTVFQKTSVKAVWRIEDGDTHQLRGIYCVTNPGYNVVYVGEVDVDEYLGDAELPYGWEQRRDENGRVFYLDHNTRTAHWVCPTVAGAADAQSENGTADAQPENGTADAQPENGATDAQPENGAADAQLENGAADTQLENGAADDQLKNGNEVGELENDDKVGELENGDEVGGDDEAEKQQVTLVQEELSGEDRTEIYSLLAELSDSEDSHYDGSMLYLSPNNDYAVAWQYTSGSATDEYWVQYCSDLQPNPRLIKEYKFLPTDRLRVDRPRLFNLASKCEVPTEDALFSNHYQLHHLGWSPDGSEYRFLYDGRGHQVLRVLGIHQSGSIRVLYEENSNTFIDVASKLYYTQLSGSDKMIWASERDGHNHLYLIDLQQGKIHNQITKGDWNVAVVDRIDEKTQRIWLSAYGFHPGEDPYHLHLVRVNFDGTGCQALTDGNGTHLWSWPFDSQQFFVDSWSRVDLPPQTVVRCSETGIVQLKLEGISARKLKLQGWVPPQRFHCPGRDGETLIYGIITKPLHFDITRSYPVIESVYAGPYDFFTPKSFGQVAYNGPWATGHYVSVQLDGMGTNWRSKRFHDVCYRNLNDGGFPDRIIWIKEAAKTRRWMNLDRMAIVGTSFGGYNAAAALLHFGHFYKVAVSDSGTHDASLVPHWWAEQWLGYPIGNLSFAHQSNVSHAGELPDDAKLMLVVGGMDSTLNPASTMRFVQQLNKAEKMYEFVFIPEGGHNCGSHGYGLKRVDAFLKRALLESAEEPT
ncbi:unnamed protein product [Clonostachys byssicola]|uniref:Probable dipeptidyl-aminopeptidase B n=1 Tax=Clonostachys byssicola TaxID=160290 RepID=A0A9N9UQF1_9HYPO|nr:unnamed protein product [Clonostachys byssicola]